MPGPQVPYVEVVVDASLITDWETCHDVFSETFGFPDWCGRNMNAWIDCMTSLDKPDDKLSRVHAPSGGILVLRIDNAKDFASRCPEQYAAIVECASFVNWRRRDCDEAPVIALSFFK